MWQSEEPRRNDAGGAFVRPESPFRDFVRADGSGAFPAEPDRYHLYDPGHGGGLWSRGSMPLNSASVWLTTQEPCHQRKSWFISKLQFDHDLGVQEL